MAHLIFDPAGITSNVIDETGIDEDAIYNEQGGVYRTQLTLLAAASNVLGDVDGTTLKKNVYKTINKLSASANKKNIDFNANIKNTMYNTVQFQVMEQLETSTTKTDRENTMIIWQPSSAEEQDPFHSLQYGKTMTMQAAMDKGLGLRWGCQCSMRIVDAPDDVIKVVETADTI